MRYAFTVGMTWSGCDKATGSPFTSAHFSFAVSFAANSWASYLSVPKHFFVRLPLWLMKTHQPGLSLLVLTLTPISATSFQAWLAR